MPRLTDLLVNRHASSNLPYRSLDYVWYIGQSLFKYRNDFKRGADHLNTGMETKDRRLMERGCFFCRPWPEEGLRAGGRALIDAAQICQRWKSGVDIFWAPLQISCQS